MKISKSKVNGWVASDTVRFGDNKQLEVYTMKSNGYLVTRAIVHTIKDGYRSHTLFEDFNKVYLKTNTKRVTEKSVSEQQSLVDMNSVLADAQTYYGV